MQKFKYVGEGSVDVPSLGKVDVTPGTHVEVNDPDVAESMHKQTDTWEHLPDPERSKAAKKAAATREES